MRRAAAIDLFDRCGFFIVPAQVWRFTDARDDVGLAVAEFIVAIGGRVERVRAGDSLEIERVNEVLDMLVEIEKSFERLDAKALARIEAALFSGEYDAVREAARTVAIYEAIVSLAERWPNDERLGCLNAFLNDVKVELADPLASTPTDASLAERLGAEMARLMERFTSTQQDQDYWIVYLRTNSEWRTWPEAAVVQSDLVRHVELSDRLRTQLFTVDETASLLDVLDEIDSSLRSAVDMRAGKRKSGKGSESGDYHNESSRTKFSELQTALIYFGFAKDAKLTLIEFKKRKRELEKATYPPPAGNGSEDLFKEFGQHRDVLKRQFGFS